MPRNPLEGEPKELFFGVCNTPVMKDETNWRGKSTQNLRACGWRTGMLGSNQEAWDALSVHFESEHPGVSGARGSVDSTFSIS